MAEKNKTINRREFIKAASILSFAGLSGDVLGLNQLSQPLSNGSDYKALVFVFLAGGNDSFNMLVPKGNSQLRQNYETARRKVALESDTLHALSLQSPAKIYQDVEYDQFGLHPSCPDLAQLFNDQELSVICNIGNLIEPVSRQQVLDKTVNLPPQLFSHSDQQLQFQSEPTKPFRYGWGGKLAEMISSENLDTQISPLISVSGQNTFQVSQGAAISPYIMSVNGAIALAGNNGQRKVLLDNTLSSLNTSSHLMMQKYRDIFFSANEAQVVVENILSEADATGIDYDQIFADAGASYSDVGKGLKTIAQMINGRALMNNNRPIYFVKMNGFDTHKNVLTDHQSLMSDLNNGLKAFADVLKQQGDFDHTLTFIGSEFGRTMTPNGDDEGMGTDHAWGGHALLMGGMVNGGQLFGTHPDLTLNRGLDASTGRGRYIPSTSTSQAISVISHWFGVPKEELTSIVPSYVNMPDPFAADSNLQFFKATEELA